MCLANLMADPSFEVLSVSRSESSDSSSTPCVCVHTPPEREREREILLLLERVSHLTIADLRLFISSSDVL